LRERYLQKDEADENCRRRVTQAGCYKFGTGGGKVMMYLRLRGKRKTQKHVFVKSAYTAMSEAIPHSCPSVMFELSARTASGIWSSRSQVVDS
jgi:hypothetical protein